MMGFGIAVLIIYLGWMLGTEDKEKFIWPLTKVDLNTKAEGIALRDWQRGSGEYKNRLDEVKCALQMRRDRGWSLLCFFVGSLIWVGAILWAYFNIQDKNQKTIPSKIIVFAYCALVVVPQIISMYLIFKEISYAV